MKIRLLDHFLISVPAVFEADTHDGIKSTNTAFFVDKERDRYERKVRRGIVHAAPIGYTETKHMPIDPGLPNPKLYVGHDDIQQKINEGYHWSNAQYHPGGTNHFKYISRAGYGERIDAKEGDEVYFHPSVTEPENEMSPGIYRCQVHELISVGTRPQGFWILVEPHAETNESLGLSLSVDGQDKMLEGTVRYAREGCEFILGQKVFFQEGSDWEFFIGEERLFAMLEENLLLTEVKF